MADTKTTDLVALGGANLVATDEFPVADVSAGATKSMTTDELVIGLKSNGMTGFVFGEPADGTIIAGSGMFWVDTTASPLTFNCKVRSADSPEVVTNFVLA